MIRRVLALAAAAALSTTLAAAAQAQDEDFEEEEYFYEKETAGYAELNLSGANFQINDSDGKDRFSGGVGAVVGGHINTHLSMEIQYDWLEYSSTHLASYNVRYVVLTDKVQPWLKVGMGLMGGRPNHAYLFMGRFSLGANVFLNEQIAIAPSLGYALAKHNNNIYLAGVGLVYYFQ